MFDLDPSYSALLIVCLVAACAFEFVNGFHDTANAVATVIYTNTLKPWVAVIWSGFCNFLGVLLGGVGVAMAIVNLLPVESLVDQNITHGISMVMAILLSAISWNLLTWYLGIPCSSSHTLIGAILGVGLAFTMLPNPVESAVNWGKAREMGISLLISPIFGFSLTIILMFVIRTLTKKTEYGEGLFKEPKKNQPPPFWIRSILFLTCTGVSFFHGQNDGQKGVGLIMLILIVIVPGFFALNHNLSPSDLSPSLTKIELIAGSMDSTSLSLPDRHKLSATKRMSHELISSVEGIDDVESLSKDDRFKIRKNIVVMDRNLKELIGKEEARVSEKDKKTLKAELISVRKITDYSPRWVILLISISLGIGTMIGWKRIVKTIGEKIGKEHLSYAQGASAELVAASTIAASTYLGLPVSTTHVLSSGIAGSMVASKGVKNLQPDIVRNILIAWLLTLPVVMLMAGSLFLLFRNIF
jgi:phosphate/sulfate permease